MSPAARAALAALLLLALVGAFAPLIAEDRPIWIREDGAPSSPLLLGLEARELFGLFVGLALLPPLLPALRRRPRALAVAMGVPLAVGALAAALHEPRFETRRYGQEIEVRRRLARLDAESPRLDPGERRRRHLREAETMPLLAGPLAEVEARLEALAGESPDEPRLRTLEQRNAAALGALEDAVFPPVPYAPDHPGFARGAPPEGGHLLGTDAAGRDLLARLVHGCRHSFGLAAAATLIAALAGLLVGAVAGYCGGAADWLLSRAIETALCLPALFLLVLGTAYVPPGPEARSLALVGFLSFVLWPLPARLVRAEVRRTRGRDWVLAARALGCSHARILARYVLPHATTSFLVAVTGIFAAALLAEAALSFLGLGVPEAPSWGQALRDARATSDLGAAWHLAVFPGLLVFLAIASLSTLGDALRDRSDPRTTVSPR